MSKEKDPTEAEILDLVGRMNRALTMRSSRGVTDEGPAVAASDLLKTEWTKSILSSTGIREVELAMEMVKSSPQRLGILWSLMLLQDDESYGDERVFCRVLLDHAASALQARGAAVCRYDPETGAIEMVYAYHAEGRQLEDTEIVRALVEEAIRRRDVVMTPGLAEDPNLPAISASRMAHPGVPAAAVRIQQKDQALGAIYVDRYPGSEPFHQDLDKAFLLQLARAAAGPMAAMKKMMDERRASAFAREESERELEEQRKRAQTEREEKERILKAMEEIRQGGYLGEMKGCNSPPMKKVAQQVLRAGQYPQAEVPVLITGPTGSGKTHIARLIHSLQDARNFRAKGEFVELNCSTLEGDAGMGAMFGIVKSTFTNVEGRPGAFQVADKGTLFLDEVGNLPLEMQAKLLKALEEGKATAHGHLTTYSFDVRVIAATSVDLDQAIKDKIFRADLCNRLRAIHIVLPPLKDRREDMNELLEYLFKDLRTKLDRPGLRGINHIARSRLRSYVWEDGNVRELANAIKAMIVQADPDATELRLSDVPHYVRERVSRPAGEDLSESLLDAVAHFRKQYLADVLIDCELDLDRACKRLKINHKTNLHKFLRGAGIKLDDLRRAIGKM